ncbi:xanthine dehydrogenase family protein molybdopterin-binding subunit [bacterium]|nr:xanthine dehydrogenase family protein molybdopterin-binding subunit [bacterium]
MANEAVDEGEAATPGVTRRQFLVTASAAGAFLLTFSIEGMTRAARAAGGAATTINTWIQLGTDDSITMLIGSSEMGQGVMTGLAQLLAEDLMVDWKRVKAEAAPAGSAYANPLFRTQLTGGSASIRGYYQALRLAGATARDMFIAAAAQTWGISPGLCRASNGTVINTLTSAALRYGELAPLAATMPVPSAPALVPDNALRIIGKSMPRVDIPSKTDGSATYGIDVRVPGMVYAVVKHCPSLGGRLVGTPAKPAGAIAVVPLTVLAGTDRGSEQTGMVNAVAVVADNTWKAMKLANQLNASWSIPTSSQSITTSALFSQADALIANGTPRVAETIGDANTAIGNGGGTLVEATYRLPYLAHATMEVLNCTVSITAGGCEIWAPTQGQLATVATAAAITGLSPDRITVHTTMLGGGLGRKIEQDFISQAVQVAKAIGKPVKLMWPREEDFTRDQFRPMAVVRVRARVGGDGTVSAWAYRNCSPSITQQRRPTFTAVDSQAIDGATTPTGLTYELGARLVEHVVHPSPVPVGYWRSVGHSINTFAIESMIDELAAAIRMDPYLLRRQLLRSDPRGLAVLDQAASLAGWGGAVPSGRARGIALAWAFNSVVAEVAEISIPTAGQIRVHRVWCAVDCGRPVNPDQITAQMQGGIVHGISAALWGQINFTAGKAGVRNFDAYPMVKLRQMPDITVQIMPPNPSVPIGGIGEPGVPPIAPAIANAYFTLTGQRVRTLPFFPGARMGGL